MNPLVYLAAHAPEEPWSVFKPDLTKIGPQPELPDRNDPSWGFTLEQRMEIFTWMTGGSKLPAYAVDFAAARDAALKARHEWEAAVDLECKLQWPWWWAQKMLAAAPRQASLQN